MLPRPPTAFITILAGLAAALTLFAPAGRTEPDYAGYRSVDPTPFRTFGTYGGAGVQFTTPTGLLCRLAVISRGQFAYATCLGDLHGVALGSNVVTIDTRGTSSYSVTTRDEFLTHQTLDGHGMHNEPISEQAFPLLPVGSSISYTDSPWSGTCAVTADTTSCTVRPTHSPENPTRSFELSPSATTLS